MSKSEKPQPGTAWSPNRPASWTPNCHAGAWSPYVITETPEEPEE